ncbi:MAG TPA: hypothetical protein VGT79_00775 [Xanthomonadaceae bacterium]|nr:hypothetical protein [Xanthomonadaceae bacterium]
MAWFLLLLAIGCFLVLFVTKSFALGVLCLVLSLVFVVAATMLLLSARITSATRNIDILSAEELRVLREQTQAKRAANAEASTTHGISAAPSSTTPESPPPTSV